MFSRDERRLIHLVFDIHVHSCIDVRSHISPRSAPSPFMHSPTSRPPVDFIKYEVQSRVIAGGTSLPPQKLISRDRTTGVVTTIVHSTMRSTQHPTRSKLVADVASARAPKAGAGGRSTESIGVTGKSSRPPRIEISRRERPLLMHHASQRSGRPISARVRLSHKHSSFALY